MRERVREKVARAVTFFQTTQIVKTYLAHNVRRRTLMYVFFFFFFILWTHGRIWFRCSVLICTKKTLLYPIYGLCSSRGIFMFICLGFIRVHGRWFLRACFLRKSTGKMSENPSLTNWYFWRGIGNRTRKNGNRTQPVLNLF